MMMIQQSKDAGLDFLVLDPSKSPPASKYADCIQAEYNDLKSLDRIAKECDIVTIDLKMYQLILSDSWKIKSMLLQIQMLLKFVKID